MPISQRDRALRATFDALARAGLYVQHTPVGLVDQRDADFVAHQRAEGWRKPGDALDPVETFYVKVRAQNPHRRHNDQGLERDDHLEYLRFDEKIGPLLLVVLNRDGVPEACWLRALGPFKEETAFKPSEKYKGSVPIRYWRLGMFRPIGDVVRDWKTDGYRVPSASLLDEGAPV